MNEDKVNSKIKPYLKNRYCNTPIEMTNSEYVAMELDTITISQTLNRIELIKNDPTIKIEKKLQHNLSQEKSMYI